MHVVSTCVHRVYDMILENSEQRDSERTQTGDTNEWQTYYSPVVQIIRCHLRNEGSRYLSNERRKET